MNYFQLLFNRPLTLCLVLSLFCASCELEGPPGPEGPQGPQGEQGLTGDPGEKGEPGTANVLYSNWITFDLNNWNKVTEFGRETQVYEILEDSITQEVMDQALVFVYIKFGGAPPPRPLPFTGYITSTSKDQIIWYRLLEGKLELVFHNINDNADPGRFGSSNSYRYIIIPGGIPINGRLSQELKRMPYEEISKMFNIPLD